MAFAGRLGVLLASLVVISALSFGQNNTAAIPTAPSAADATQTVAPGSAIPVAVDSRSYQLGANDVISINVFNEPKFSGPQLVGPDGMISIPLIGAMQAAGLTPDRLAAQLEQALTMLNEPDVTVSVIQVNSKTYTLTGQVMRAGKFPMPTPIRISEALNLAGGFGQWANLKKITIVRGNERIYFNYNDWKKGKNLDKDIFLQSGDQIIVD